MPLVTVQINSKWTLQEKKQMLTALQTAVLEGLGVSEEALQIRINEYPPENLLLLAGQSDKYLVIEIALFLGRTFVTKKRLYQSINAKLNEIGIAETDIFIVLHEAPMENFGINGGKPASEIKFNYDINI